MMIEPQCSVHKTVSITVDRGERVAFTWVHMESGGGGGGEELRHTY